MQELVTNLMKRLQTALKMTDAELGYYLHTDATTIRKVRAREDDLPSHSTLVLFDRTAFLAITSATLALVPKKSREKALLAIQRQALSLAQVEELRQLQAAVRHEESAKSPDNREG